MLSLGLDSNSYDQSARINIDGVASGCPKLNSNGASSAWNIFFPRFKLPVLQEEAYSLTVKLLTWKLKTCMRQGGNKKKNPKQILLRMNFVQCVN